MENQGTKSKQSNWWVVLVSVLVLHLYLLFRLKFTAWPEMTFWPYLILKGWLPYKDIAIVHTPLLLIGTSIFSWIFGVGLAQLKIYTWILILSTDIALFFVVKRLWNKKTAILTLLIYIFLQTFYQGNGLWFDLCLGFIAIIIYFFLRKKKYLWAGFFWALAFLTKQTAFWFLIPAGLTILQGLALQNLQDLNKVGKRVKKFMLGVLLVIIPSILVLLLLGILPNFWHWAFSFGVGLLPRAYGQISLPTLKQLTISIIPFSLLFFVPFLKDRKKSLILSSWIVFGVLGAIPRFELFHFQPALPFLAIAAGLVLSDIGRLKPVIVYALSGYLLLMVVLVGRFYTREWGMGDRFFEPEIIRVASYIENNIDPNHKIFLLNTWDSVYALSDTLPAARPWIPHFPWYMELPGVQRDIVGDLEKEQPEMIVVREYSESGLSSYRPELIDNYITENYEFSDKIEGHLIFLPKQ